MVVVVVVSTCQFDIVHHHHHHHLLTSACQSTRRGKERVSWMDRISAYGQVIAQHKRPLTAGNETS